MLSGGVAVLMMAGAASAADSRVEFNKLLRMMPPNGEPEHYGNVILRERSKKRGIRPAIFPHWSHRAKYTCKVCHMELDFNMPKTGNVISRGGNLAGRYCGACHDGKTAFSVRYETPKHCDRCHLPDTKALDERFRKFAKDMPKSSYGNKIDWNKAIEEGKIKPKDSIYGDQPAMPLPDNLKKPLVMRSSSPRDTVYFSHRKHIRWIDCSTCHPYIFNIKQKTTEYFSMNKNLYGWFCGTCHMRVAFPMNDCHRCHPAIRSGTGARAF